MKTYIRVLAMALCLATALLGLTACQDSTKKTDEPANRLEAILQRGYIEVVMDPTFAPNQFIDPSKEGDEKYVGSDVELMRYIADKLGVEARLVPLEFGAVQAGITEGKYDMAISALAYTPLREEAMNLSKGYHFSKSTKGHGLLIRVADKDTITGPAGVAGKVVVAQSGSLQELFVTQQLEGYSEFKRVTNTPDGYLMVQEGKADVAVTSIVTGELYIEANPDAGLMIVENFQFHQDESTLGTRIGMPKGEDELTAAVNEIIDEVLASGIYEKWYDEYTEYAASLGV